LGSRATVIFCASTALATCDSSCLATVSGAPMTGATAIFAVCEVVAVEGVPMASGEALGSSLFANRLAPVSQPPRLKPTKAVRTANTTDLFPRHAAAASMVVTMTSPYE